MNKTMRKAMELGKKLAEMNKQKEKQKCTACNGSGHYDVKNSPKCAACNGTGLEN